MTDARLPSRWLTDPAMESLTDRLWRIHTGALMWSAEQATDGRLTPRTLRLLHPEGATAADAHALVASGLWSATGDGFEVAGWGRTQSLAADVEAARAANRDRQARYRARQAPADVTRDVTRESLRQGEERLGLGVESSSRDGGEGDAPPPATCPRHPNGTDSPCMACKRARLAAVAWEQTQASKPRPPREHVHKWTKTSPPTCAAPTAGDEPCMEHREVAS